MKYVDLKAIVEEINEELRGAHLSEYAKVREIKQLGAASWSITSRLPGRNVIIEISQEKPNPYLFVHDGSWSGVGIEGAEQESERVSEKPSAYTMLLRKTLTGTILTRVELADNDRIVTFSFKRHYRDDSTGKLREEEYRWVVELSPVYANAVLISGTVAEGEIMGLSKASEGERRGVLKLGGRYAEPMTSYEPGTESSLRLDEIAVGERSSVVSRWIALEYGAARLGERLGELRRRLKRELKRYRRRAEAVEGDLAAIEAASEYQRRGTLLQSAQRGGTARGRKSVTVVDYFDPSLAEVEIDLNPKWTLQENIDHLFSEYRRLTGARAYVETRLIETYERIEVLTDRLQRIENIEDFEGCDELEATLEKEGLLSPLQEQVRRTKNVRLPYREYSGSTGRKILVGKTAQGNDTLTVQIARGRDIWLHAHNYAGSHVVMRMENRGDVPTSEELMEAAYLAAWHSKARRETAVEVEWTRAKYVRKGKSMAAGQVTVSEGKVVLVRMGDESLRKLLDKNRR